MTVKRKTTYCAVRCTHMKLARQHMRKVQVEATVTDRNL